MTETNHPDLPLYVSDRHTASSSNGNDVHPLFTWFWVGIFGLAGAAIILGSIAAAISNAPFVVIPVLILICVTVKRARKTRKRIHAWWLTV